MKGGRTSELWNTDQLIYNTEMKFELDIYKSICDPVLGMVVLYLAAGSDLTEKLYGKTHETFLIKWMKHARYVKDLVSYEDETKRLLKVDQSAYRRLIHCLWCSPNGKEPPEILFSKIYADTKEQKDRSNHLPNKRVISELSKCVCRTLQSMMSYVSEISIPNWLAHVVSR